MTKKVKIIKASKDTYWYKNKIGEVFEVSTNCDFGYYRVMGHSEGRLIERVDCVDANLVPHIHAEVIKAWADGNKVLCSYNNGKTWKITNSPQFLENGIYKIEGHEHKHQEMMDAYSAVLKQTEAMREAELRPEKKLEEKKAKEVVQLADSLSSEGVAKEIGNLKIEIGKMLTQISDRLEAEVNKYRGIRNAIEFKEKELHELYEIEKSAMALAALIESQNQKRQTFESEMAAKKEALNQEIETLREEWEKEKNDYETAVKERDVQEKKRREREKEEFEYAFKREQKLAKDKFEDDKVKLEKEIQIKKVQMESELKEREKIIAERENELVELRNKVSSFPKETDAAVSKAVNEITQKLNLEAKNREELQKKDFVGEKNVLTTRIEALEKMVKEQNEKIAKLSQQLEKAYQQVQDIAVKTIEGSSNIMPFASLQQWISEQVKKSSQEK